MPFIFAVPVRGEKSMMLETITTYMTLLLQDHHDEGVGMYSLTSAPWMIIPSKK
jgi:hypothetical protein